MKVNRKKSIFDFLSQYTSQNTKNLYASTLRKFFDYHYPELAETLNGIRSPEAYQKHDSLMDEISLEYVKDSERDYEQDIINFRDNFLKDRAPKTRLTQLTVIFRFLKTNDIDFDDSWKKNIIGRGASKAISKVKIPSPEQLKRILYHLPPQAKAYTMVIATGGLRPGEARKLRLSDFELGFVAQFRDREGQVKKVPIPRINIRAETTRMKVPRFTFITEETKNEIERWLKFRPEYISKIEGLSHKKLDERRMFPFTGSAFNSLWQTALRRAGLYDRDQRTGVLSVRPHNIRKFFRTWGGWSNPDIPKCLMGHQEGMDAIYSRPEQALRILVEEYKRIEPNLTMLTPIEMSVPSEELENLQSRITQLRLEKLEETDRYRKETEGLKEQLVNLTLNIEDLRRELDAQIEERVSKIVESQLETLKRLGATDMKEDDPLFKDPPIE
jgi:integrase